MPGSIVSIELSNFKANLLEIVKNMEEPTPQTFENFTKELYKTLMQTGLRLLREILHFWEPKENSIQVAEEGEFQYKKSEPKEFATLFGKVKISRRIYYNARIQKTYVPLDSYWGMVGQYATTEVRERIGYLTGFLNPKTIFNIFKRFTCYALSQTTIAKIGSRIGKAFNEANTVIVNEAHMQEKIPEQTQTLAVSLDGVNVMLRESGSRARRPRTRPGHDDPLKSGKSCYKNAGVATLSFYGRSNTNQELFRIKSLFLANSPEERMTSLKRELEAELAYYLSIASSQMRKVVIMDGARGLWKYIHQHELFKGWTYIVDFHHCCEHLSQFAEKLFGKNSAIGQKWYSKCRKRLLNDINGVHKVIRSAKRYLLDKGKKFLMKELSYFVNNQRKVNYAVFRSQGLPIGSGPVEAACKTIVKARLCCSGMRWTRRRAQEILRIRTTIKNNRWNVAWLVCKYTPTSATN